MRSLSDRSFKNPYILVPCEFLSTQNCPDESEDVSTQVFVLDDVLETGLDIVPVDGDLFLLRVWGLKGDLVHKFFQNRVETTGPDIFCPGVNEGGEAGNLADALWGEDNLHPICGQELRVLAGEGVLKAR